MRLDGSHSSKRLIFEDGPDAEVRKWEEEQWMGKGHEGRKGKEKGEAHLARAARTRRRRQTCGAQTIGPMRGSP